MSDRGRHVAILLCTRNGARFLPGQLDSIAAQTHTDWRVWASDDASTDATLDLLARYRGDWGDDRLTILKGPGQGGPANFLALARNGDIAGDYFAFADQDDLWYADKLARALTWLEGLPPGQAALYCARTDYIDADDRLLGRSPRYRRPPAFANALVQNIAGGNTMVFNPAARALIASLRPDTPVIVHDWWAYQIVAGAGGTVHHDDRPCLGYRQHAGNLIGSNAGLYSRVQRAWQSLLGTHRTWQDTQIAALAGVATRLTAANAACLAHYRTTREAGPLARVAGILQAGLYRQTLVQQAWLLTQAALRRI